MTETYRYDAFGTLAGVQRVIAGGVFTEAETALSRFLYAGEQYDEVTGLYYLRARQYDTSIGRFTQEDTYLGDGRNLFAYVSSNPLKYVDPSGHDKISGYKFYNPDSLPYAMAAEALVDLIPDSFKRELSQGYVDNFWPTELEISSIEEFTIGYFLGYGLAEITPMEDILSLGKDIKRFGKAADVTEEIIENADNLDDVVTIIDNADGKWYDFIAKLFKKNSSDVVEEVYETGRNFGYPNAMSSLLNEMGELAGTTREKLLSGVQNEDLYNIIDQLYRPGAKVGDGGTAAILVDEFNNNSSKHLQKATERLQQLQELQNSGDLGLNDLDIIEALIDDLEYAIGLFD